MNNNGLFMQLQENVSRRAKKGYPILLAGALFFGRTKTRSTYRYTTDDVKLRSGRVQLFLSKIGGLQGTRRTRPNE
ncbi:hypothetical protein MUG87_10635 [Ectobacillus sp. JY-23]|uniref:hypothetical protein n=1 Tax=Ectobacillus sp. JY-23 TaxID=2933872 RepID=UPI001FF13541|nr:hypothetical protein [Ectobacillus sp. JY-23]UOY91029.1 hypothetical protein MUG87_10635 [Ectobacillus sp. JY-23]